MSWKKRVYIPAWWRKRTLPRYGPSFKSSTTSYYYLTNHHTKLSHTIMYLQYSPVRLLILSNTHPDTNPPKRPINKKTQQNQRSSPKPTRALKQNKRFAHKRFASPEGRPSHCLIGHLLRAHTPDHIGFTRFPVWENPHLYTVLWSPIEIIRVDFPASLWITISISLSFKFVHGISIYLSWVKLIPLYHGSFVRQTYLELLWVISCSWTNHSPITTDIANIPLKRGKERM